MSTSPAAPSLPPPRASPPPHTQTLVESPKVVLTRKDLITLQVGTWLNDEVINAYMYLCQVGAAAGLLGGGCRGCCAWRRAYWR